MKKFNPPCYLLILLLSACISSCHTDSLILPMHQSTRLNAIAKLPANQQIRQKEMKDWYTANFSNTPIEPQWENTMQTLHDGHHVIELPVGTHAAFFFTKVNGNLSVDAYRWKDMNPGILPFTGAIVSYSFQKNKIIGIGSKQGTIIKTDTFDVPDGHLYEFLDVLMLGDIWTMMKLK